MHNKKLSSFAAIFAAVTVVLATANFARGADSCNDHIVISQIYGGGGNSGATYKNDFIELYNPTEEAIDLESWSVQYASASGSFTGANSTSLSGTIAAKSYYLISEASGSGTAEALPTPDDFGTTNLSTTAGKVALVNNTEAVSNKSDENVIDFVGYGNANEYEGTAPAPAPSSNNKQGITRYESCLDSNHNEADFKQISPLPKNSSFIEENENDPQDDDDSDIQDEPTNDEDLPDESESCATTSENIKLNEIFPYPESGDEFVEVANTGDDCVDVSGWKIMDGADHKKAFPENSIIEPGEYLYLEGNLYLNNDSDTAYLLDANGAEKTEALDSLPYEKAQKGFSYGFNGQSFAWSSTPTPGKNNMVDSDPVTDSPAENEDQPKIDNEENFSNAEGIFLNEILPNPRKNSDDEYIEIANNGSDSVDLLGWTIRDGSKNGKYVFRESAIIETGEYLVIYRPQSKLSLNNTTESLTLFNPQGETVSNVSWETSKKNSSYNFDGENWKWSKYLTPGKDNEFDSEPSVKIKKPKHAYKNLFTEFSAKVKDKETKKLEYSWDFGDGKKSSLENPTHKYLDTGKYTVTLSVSDDSQTVEKSFSLQVKKYPRPNIEIVKIVPNPAGADSENEIIEVRNNSKKKIALTDWKIATGSGENAYNHPIIDEISLEPNETKMLTREFSKFSLNNKAGKVSLVLPDGKIADTVEYAKEKIAEGEAYAKIDGQWQWLDPDAQGEDDIAEEPVDEGVITDGEVLGASNESISPSYDSRFTSEDAYIFLSRINFMRTVERKMTYRPASNPSSNIAYLIASLI